PAEARIDPRFNVLDETQTVLLMQEAAEATLARVVADEQMLPLLALLPERPLLELITTLLKQRLAVEEVVCDIPAGTILDHWQRELEKQQERALQQLQVDHEFIMAYRCLRDNKARDQGDLRELERPRALAAVSALDNGSLPLP